MDELNKFSKRFKRYADLGTSAGSLALNYLGSKIFFPFLEFKILDPR